VVREVVLQFVYLLYDSDKTSHTVPVTQVPTQMATRKKRVVGVPLKSGAENPASMPSRLARKALLDEKDARIRELEARIEAMATASPDPDADTSPRVMRKVLGQNPNADLGPAEGVLREWLAKDPKGFIAAIEEKERVAAGDAGLREENARLSAELSSLRGSSSSGPDLGAAKAREIVEGLLKEFEATHPEGL
jgi:hypothetical protein